MKSSLPQNSWLRLNGNLGGTLNDGGVGPGRIPPFHKVSVLKFTGLEVERSKPTSLDCQAGPNLNCTYIFVAGDVDNGVVSTVVPMDIGLGSGVP
jgi:hypothetical protein